MQQIILDARYGQIIRKMAYRKDDELETGVPCTRRYASEESYRKWRKLVIDEHELTYRVAARVLKDTKVIRERVDAAHDEAKRVIEIYKDWARRYDQACDRLGARISRWEKDHPAKAEEDAPEPVSITEVMKKLDEKKEARLQESIRMKRLKHARECPKCRAAKKYLKYVKPLNYKNMPSMVA